ncbi:hypothetical protein JB92DRAFT_2953775 [Gautieria morchelliformis]|nr:hypothetical protein JB92DRAFT_2953775 [Gautieria morchelliformis]
MPVRKDVGSRKGTPFYHLVEARHLHHPPLTSSSISSQAHDPSILCSPFSSINSHSNANCCCGLKNCNETPSSSSHNLLSGSDDALDNVPASSTPDLIHSSDATCASTSPDVSLAQRIFASRLHALLQVIEDQQYKEESDFSPQKISGDEGEWIRVSQGGAEVASAGANVSRLSRKTDSNDSSDEVSNTSSTSTLGVWAPSPLDLPTESLERYSESSLTHHNKRKHDESHELSGGAQSGSSPVVLHKNVACKKAKLSKFGERTSSSFSYQAGETASCRKLKSLTSASSSSSLGVDSEHINSTRCFSHPIIHPPTEPIPVLTSRREVAESRIEALLKRERYYRAQDGLPLGLFDSAEITSNNNEELFGIEADFRRQVVQWIFDVLPPTYFRPEDLYRHLKCSEETRFHAMYLFSRYVFRVRESRGGRCYKETRSLRRARRELMWDVAFCSLAISTKFYHDFLYPLYPIYSHDFLTISPQLTSSFHFEHTQRNILEAFDYEIFGITPHAFFEELWAALPRLQDMLDYGRPRDIIRNEMWARLQRASLELDMMRFPISLLTAAALAEGIILALVDEYQQTDQSGTSSPTLSHANVSSDDLDLEKAYKDVIPICSDVATVLGVSMADLRACRRWMSSFN